MSIPDSLNSLKTICKEFAYLAGLPPPLFDIDGQTFFALDSSNTLIIALDSDDDEALLLIPLHGSSKAMDEKHALPLLKDAYLGQHFGGAAVGIDPVSESLVLWRRLPISGLNAAMLLKYVESLHRNAMYWSTHLNSWP